MRIRTQIIVTCFFVVSVHHAVLSMQTLKSYAYRLRSALQSVLSKPPHVQTVRTYYKPQNQQAYINQSQISEQPQIPWYNKWFRSIKTFFTKTSVPSQSTHPTEIVKIPLVRPVKIYQSDSQRLWDFFDAKIKNPTSDDSLQELSNLASNINTPNSDGNTVLYALFEAFFVQSTIKKVAEYVNKHKSVSYFTIADKLQNSFSQEYQQYARYRLQYIDALLEIGADLGANKKEVAKKLVQILIDKQFIVVHLENTDIPAHKFILLDKQNNIKLPLRGALIPIERRLRSIAKKHGLSYGDYNAAARSHVQQEWEQMFGEEREEIRKAKHILGLSINTNPETSKDLDTIKKIRNDVANIYHPDRLHNALNEEKLFGQEKTEKIIKAYKIIENDFKLRTQPQEDL